MRKLIAGSLFLAAGLLLLGLAVLPANTADASEATIVRFDGTCCFFDANGICWGDPESRGQLVNTNNDRGNGSLYCKGQLPDVATLPDKAMHWTSEDTGFGCGRGFATFKGVTTPSGNWSFTCKNPE